MSCIYFVTIFIASWVICSDRDGRMRYFLGFNTFGIMMNPIPWLGRFGRQIKHRRGHLRFTTISNCPLLSMILSNELRNTVSLSTVWMRLLIHLNWIIQKHLLSTRFLSTNTFSSKSNQMTCKLAQRAQFWIPVHLSVMCKTNWMNISIRRPRKKHAQERRPRRHPSQQAEYTKMKRWWMSECH